MSQRTPKITVLTSVYNAERFLEESLRSICRQSFGDFEFIVIDDGSTDTSPEIARSFASEDERILLIRQDNVGLTRSLNRGLSRARGEFVARHDADDISLPERLAEQLEYMTRHPDCAVTGCRYERIDAEGRLLLVPRIRTSDFAIRKRLLDQNAIPHPGAMFRRALVESVGGYDETLTTAQDYDLWCRLASAGRLHNTGRVLLRRRVHDEQVGSQRKQEQDDCRDRIREQYRRRVATGLAHGLAEWYLRFVARRRLKRISSTDPGAETG